MTVEIHREMAGVIYTARLDGGHGHIKDYEIYLSQDAQDWGAPAAKGNFPGEAEAVTVRFKARYLKFVALSEQEGRPFATIAESEVIGTNHDLVRALNETSAAKSE